MNITAERVTGTAYVVAADETSAMEAFAAGDTFDDKRSAIGKENSRNHLRAVMGDYDDPEMNTYKITVTAQQVH